MNETVAVTPPGDPMIGRVIADRYRILSKLGEGGMGAVYKAEQTKMSRLCAIKILSSSFASDRDALARFNREAQMSSRFDHPHAVTIYDFGEAEGGLHYLAMEFVEGEMLSTILRREGALPVERVLHLARQAGAALESAHRMSIVHRDLKPDNIMVTRKDNIEWVKVLDFGIAKVAGENPQAGQDLTQAGMVIGTPLYMSPEQLAGEKLDPRSDVYSFAIIVYQMLSGALPFQGDNVQSMMIKRLTEAPLSLRMVNPQVQVAPGIEQALMMGLARHRDQRCQTVSQFVTALENGAAMTGGIAPAGPMPTISQGSAAGTVPFPNADSYNTAQNQQQNTPPNFPYPTQQQPPPQPQMPPPQQQYSGGQPMPTMPAPNPISLAKPGEPSGGYQPQPMAQASGGYAQPSGQTYPPAPPVMPPQPARKKGGMGIILVVVFLLFAVVLVGGGIGGYFLFIRKADPVVTNDPNGNNGNNGNNGTATPETQSTTFLEGAKALDSQNYAQAEEKFVAVLKEEPNNGKAHLNLGIAFYHQKKLARADTEFGDAANLCSDTSCKNFAHKYKGLAYWENKKYSLAADEFREAYRQNSKDLTARAFLAFMLVLDNKRSEATPIFNELLEAGSLKPELRDAVKQVKDGAGAPQTASDAGVGPGQ